MRAAACSSDPTTAFVYSLDAATGCVYWSFEAQAGIRTAVSLGPIKTATGTRHAAYFGDLRANVFAVDAETGAQIWTQRVDTHAFARITGAPTLANGKLYVPVSSFEEGSGANDRYECCTFRGSVAASTPPPASAPGRAYTIDPPKPTRKNTTGTQLYAPSGDAIWSAPTIDLKRNVVYIATGNEYSGEGGPMSDAVIAFDLDTGERSGRARSRRRMSTSSAATPSARIARRARALISISATRRSCATCPTAGASS